MSDRPSTHAELLLLCGKVRDDAVNAEDAKRLDVLLQSGTEAKALYVQYMSVVSLMESRGAAERDTPAVAEPVDVIDHDVFAELLQLEREAEAELVHDVGRESRAGLKIQARRSSNREIRSSRKDIIIPKAVFYGAIAAMLLIGAVIWLAFKGDETQTPQIAQENQAPEQEQPLPAQETDNEPAPVIAPPVEVEPKPSPQPALAQVVGGYQPVWDKAPEQGLRAGQLLWLKEGFAELRFTQGAVVLVQAPARVEAISPTRIRVESGRLFATTEGSESIFEVDTPNLRVTDLGTSFGVFVDPETGKSESYVYSGRVHAVPVDGEGQPFGDGVMLGRTESVSIERGAKIQIGVVDSHSFVTDSEDARYTVQTRGQARYVGRVVVNDETADTLKSDRYCRVLLEQTRVLPSEPVEAAIVNPGLYEDFVALEESIRLQSAVDSYLVRFKTESGQLTSITGRVTFPRPIKGVIFSTAQRISSDRWFALPDSELGTQSGNGLEPYLERQKTNLINDSDSIRLSDDRLTIDFELAAKGIDQFRVLIESEEGAASP